MRVYPCGYSANSAQMFALMESDPTLLLVDLRFNPDSSMAVWKYPYLTETYDARYVWVGDTLGNVNYRKNGRPIRLTNPRSGIAHLVDLLQQGYHLLPFCACANYETCHRHVVIDLLLAALPNLEVIHPDQVERPDTLKCLSIRQPWTWLILHPDILEKCLIPTKTIENRDWAPFYRGPLLIHAGKTVDQDLFTRGRLDPDYWEYKFGSAGLALHAAMPQHKNDYPHGIVGRAILSSVVTASKSTWFNGPYGLELSNVTALTPIAYPGQMKVFDIPVSALSKELVL